MTNIIIPTAPIVEIFHSIQGEGLHVGKNTTFVRFQTCNMNCCYCDTPKSLCSNIDCKVETSSQSQCFELIPNPITVDKLESILDRFDNTMLSITGGEPLLQTTFIHQWLSNYHHNRHILLETNGINFKELGQVLPYTSTISMDIKLPSSTGCRPHWEDHDRFLKKAAASGKELYVKLVITNNTTDIDIEHAIQLITKINRHIPTILQPASHTLKFFDTVSDTRLKSIERICCAYLPHTQIIPQMHKLWNVL